MSKQNNENHAKQLNPNNDAFWQSRGHDERPDDWADKVEQPQGERDNEK